MRRAPENSYDMFDVADVTFDIKERRSRREIHLVARSDSDFNLLKYALSLRMFVEQIEAQLGLMDEAEGEH